MTSTSIFDRVVGAMNRTKSLNGSSFRGATPLSPPTGRRRNWTHYGVMVPGLPNPHRFFGVMSILGTPGVEVFANDHAVTTTPEDTVYTVSCTAAMEGGQFFAHSIRRDCEFHSDGSHLSFGNDLLIEGGYPNFTVHRRHPKVHVELNVRATGTVSWFAHVPGIYDHWSLLCDVQGTIVGGGNDISVSTLGTFEYAKGVGIHSFLPRMDRKLPVKFFTYHVLNLNESTQALLVVVLGPAGLPIQRRAYIRGIDDHGAVYTHGFEFEVLEYEPDQTRTPDGRCMRLPRLLRWCASDAAGTEVISVVGMCNADFAYGLGAGYVGSYAYTGSYRGQPIEGCAYLEYIDCR